MDFVELVGVVKRHLLDAMLRGISHIRFGLARLRVDDPSWMNTKFEDLLDFGFGCAVESGTQCRQKA